MIFFLMFFSTTRVIFLKYRPDTFRSRSQRLLIDSYCVKNECLIAKGQANWSQFLAFFFFFLFALSLSAKPDSLHLSRLVPMLQAFPAYTCFPRFFQVHLKRILPCSPCCSSQSHSLSFEHTESLSSEYRPIHSLSRVMTSCVLTCFTC